MAPSTTRDAVLQRMRAMADLAEREHVVLLHENEKDIYGDIPERVFDLIESVGSEALRVAWDSATSFRSECVRLLMPTPCCGHTSPICR